MYPPQPLLSSLSPPPGIKPNSEYLKGSKIHMDSKNFVTVDKVSELFSSLCISATYLPKMC